MGEVDKFARMVQPLSLDHPYWNVLRRARRGEYPLRALQVLRLQEEGQQIECRDLRSFLQKKTGIYPTADVFLIAKEELHALAGDDTLALYQPDIVWAASKDRHLLLHELLHSVQNCRSGPLPLGSDPALLLLQEALTEEWVVAIEEERGIYLQARKLLCELTTAKERGDLFIWQGDNLLQRFPSWRDWQAKVEPLLSR